MSLSPLSSLLTHQTNPRSITIIKIKLKRLNRWTTLYPLYIDSKQPHKSGGRRISSKYALNWPLAESMARGCLSLRFETVFEVSFNLSLYFLFLKVVFVWLSADVSVGGWVW